MRADYQRALPVRGRSSDEWVTPSALFTSLHERFGFDLDVAATSRNAKCSRYFTAERDGLSQSWAGARIWCNPPFSEVGRWVAKACAEALTAGLIVMIAPANRTGQPWWARLVEPARDRGLGLRTEFLPGRVHFIREGADPMGPGERPTFASCLLIWGDDEA